MSQRFPLAVERFTSGVDHATMRHTEPRTAAKIIRIIADNGPSTATEIGENLDVRSRRRLTRAIHQLQMANLLVLSKNRSATRPGLYNLTPMSRELLIDAPVCLAQTFP